jgi:hypothetical protein
MIGNVFRKMVGRKREEIRLINLLIGSWLLLVGCWLVLVGCWLLLVGCLLLIY